MRGKLAIMCALCLVVACDDDRSENSESNNGTANDSTGSNSTGSNSTGNNSTGNNSTGSNSTGSNSTDNNSAAENTAGASQEPHDGEPWGTLTFSANGQDFEYTLYARNARRLGGGYTLSALNNPTFTGDGVFTLNFGPLKDDGPGTYTCDGDDETLISLLDTRGDETINLTGAGAGQCEVVVTAASEADGLAGTFTATILHPSRGTTWEVTNGAFRADLVRE